MGKPRAKSNETPRTDDEQQERFGDNGSGKRTCKKRLESQLNFGQQLQMLECDKENWAPNQPQNEDSPLGPKQIKMD